MPIDVICPGCHVRFQVSEKFGGQKGPCPKCKYQITIPSANEQVEVHAPEEFESGGRGIDGKLTLKPIEREESRVTPLGLTVILGTIVLTVVVAYFAGEIFKSNLLLRSVGIVVISPVLTFAGYTFLRDMEAEHLVGNAVYLRSLACGVAYSVLWGIFAYMSGQVLTGEMWTWLLVAPPFLVTGALAALALFNFDFTTGMLHYAFYVLIFIVLRWLIGMGWIWQIGQVVT